MIKSPLSGWMGGKWQLSKQIVPLIPEHECYVEPFAGAAWVMFRKSPSGAEVLNDINRDIVTLYRVLQHHLEEFVRYFRWVLVSRDEFERWLQVRPDTLTDIQRAARFYYVQKCCFAGRIVAPTFGTATTRPPRLNLLRIEEELSAAHLRLTRVYVENLPSRTGRSKRKGPKVAYKQHFRQMVYGYKSFVFYGYKPFVVLQR